LFKKSFDNSRKTIAFRDLLIPLSIETEIYMTTIFIE
jgi:hypothetical protein